MRRRTFVASAAGFLGANALARGATLSASTPDLIVTNATIHTVDPRFPNPEAFVVRNGHFGFVGSLRGAKNYASRGAKTLDLAHATVLPGLIDSHLHLLNVGMALHEVDLFHLTSYEDVVRKTVEYARASPDPWIIGDGWDQNLWHSKAFPTHDALTAALPNRPVILRRVDDHALLANAPFPAGGRIIRDASGNPTLTRPPTTKSAAPPSPPSPPPSATRA
ncbi:MAG TPA: amidohydrolase family protein [Candidatus Rubrimentiphilum sp.]|nr:amidohydrolase family protein [Candidatus Rubrimentiphilum sp.]